MSTVWGVAALIHLGNIPAPPANRTICKVRLDQHYRYGLPGTRRRSNPVHKLQSWLFADWRWQQSCRSGLPRGSQAAPGSHPHGELGSSPSSAAVGESAKRSWVQDREGSLLPFPPGAFRESCGREMALEGEGVPWLPSLV